MGQGVEDGVPLLFPSGGEGLLAGFANELRNKPPMNAPNKVLFTGLEVMEQPVVQPNWLQ